MEKYLPSLFLLPTLNFSHFLSSPLSYLLLLSSPLFLLSSITVSTPVLSSPPFPFLPSLMATAGVGGDGGARRQWRRRRRVGSGGRRPSPARIRRQWSSLHRSGGWSPSTAGTHSPPLPSLTRSGGGERRCGRRGARRLAGAQIRRLAALPPQDPASLSSSSFPPQIQRRGEASVAVRPDGSVEAGGGDTEAADDDDDEGGNGVLSRCRRRRRRRGRRQGGGGGRERRCRRRISFFFEFFLGFCFSVRAT